MPNYKPISIGMPLKASESDLVNFHWAPNYIFADFILPDREEHLLRVAFDSSCIVRLLDEMPLSTEDKPGFVVGLVSENFAYIVKGAAFAEQQSATWREIMVPTHYRFVTGWGCMDVLSSAEPSFQVIKRPADAP